MKKFLSTAIIMAMLAATVTGCSNNNNSSDAGSSEGNSSVVSGDTGSDTSGDNSDNAEAALTAKDMAANIMTAVEWPAMMEITDAETANLMVGIDLNLCEDYYFTNQMMSVHLNEVLIAKPKAGSEDALKEQFDARFDYIKNGAAFYPEQEESAAGAVNGTTEDGYLFIIVHADGAKAQEAMLNNPPAEMPSADAGADMGGDVAEGTLNARDMAANIYAATEWPMLMEVTDSETAQIMGIDLGLLEDYYIAMPMMSAHVTEIIIAKPIAGNEDAVQEQIDARLAYVQENGTFYPENEKVVAGAAYGKTDDGYIYVIVHENGSVCADNMMNNPPAEMPGADLGMETFEDNGIA